MDKNKLLLPWYITETLTERERNSVEVWMQREPNAEVYYQNTVQLSQFVNTQESHVPSPQVRTQLFAKVRRQPIQSKNRLDRWIWAGTIMLSIFILLWLIVQPGTQLQWSISGNQSTAFRIYRASAGSSQFKLIEELAATPNQQTYQYADYLVVPGQNYQYIIEVRDQIGNITFSQAAMSDSLMIFAAQIAILLTSFMLTFGIIIVTQEVRSCPQFHLAV